MLLVIGIDGHFLKLIVAGNRYRLTPSLIYCSADTVLTCDIKNLSLKQIAIDRNVQSMPVRAIYYGTGRRNRLFLKIGIDIPLIKPIVSENRYR